jgi:hypothetical protein
MADVQDNNITPLRPKADSQTRAKPDQTNSEQDDEVITKPLAPGQALTRLREVGAVEGIAEFARMVGWERTAASRLVDQWARDGKVVCRARPGRKTTIEAVVTAVPAAVQPPVQPHARVDARGLDPGSTWRQSHVPRHAPLVLVAYGFFALEIAINIKNAWGGALVDVAIPATLGVLAACVMLWLPSWAMTLPFGRRLVAFSLLVLLVWPFAFTNNLRMASIVAADVTMARADRQTGATESTKTDLDRARDAQDKVCGPGQGKSKACQLRQNEVAEAKNASKDARSNVAAAVKPDSADFAKLVTWASFRRIEPKADDFDMLMLLLRTLLPQIGGLLLMLARR